MIPVVELTSEERAVLGRVCRLGILERGETTAHDHEVCTRLVSLGLVVETFAGDGWVPLVNLRRGAQ